MRGAAQAAGWRGIKYQSVAAYVAGEANEKKTRGGISGSLNINEQCDVSVV